MSIENGWELVDWDGNPELGFKCWRKKFDNGHVSVGCGEFLDIVFSFGANSDRSYSSTRWRKQRVLSEEEGIEYAERRVKIENAYLSGRQQTFPKGCISGSCEVHCGDPACH